MDYSPWGRKESDTTELITMLTIYTIRIQQGPTVQGTEHYGILCNESMGKEFKKAEYMFMDLSVEPQI